jgi:hypothetical protein
MQAYDTIVVGAGHNGLSGTRRTSNARARSAPYGRRYGDDRGVDASRLSFGFQFANLSPVPEELGLAEFGLVYLYGSGSHPARESP